IEWMTSMTYQAASGAGAANMIELAKQMNSFNDVFDENIDALLLEKKMRELALSSKFPTDLFKAPLATSLIPYIDSEYENGQSKEEWKAGVEANKILGSKSMIPIDGTCVRVGAMR